MGSPPVSSEEMNELFSPSEIDKIYKTKLCIFSTYFGVVIVAGLYYSLAV